MSKRWSGALVALVVACGGRTGLLGSEKKPPQTTFEPSQPQSGSSGDEGAGQGGAGGAGGEPMLPLPESVWVKSFGNSENQTVLAMVVEDSGTFTVTGSVAGTLDFGDGRTVVPDNQDLLLAQFDANGTPRWTTVYGAVDEESGFSIAVGPTGDFVVGGQTSPGVIGVQSSMQALITHFDHNGTLLFARSFGNARGFAAASGVTFAERGRMAAVGNFNGIFDLGGAQFTDADGWEPWLGALDAKGAPDWSTTLGAPKGQSGTAIAYSAEDGGLLVAGFFGGTLKAGACPTLVAAGEYDGWLGWFTAEGECRNSIHFGVSGATTPIALALSKGASPLVAVVGQLNGKLVLGTDSIEADKQGSTDVFVAVFSRDAKTSSFSPRWLRRIGRAGTFLSRAVTFDSKDDLIVAGDYDGGDAALALGDRGNSAFTVKYDANGTVVWSKSWGSGGAPSVNAVGTDQHDYIYVAGSFEGELPIDGQSLHSAGNDDIFVLKLPP